MMSPEPGEVLIEISEVKQEKQERLEDMEDRTEADLDAWKNIKGSGIALEDSLLSTFFGDKIERLKEDLSHMIQLELEEMKEMKDVSKETLTEYASREEGEVVVEYDEYEAMVDMEEAEIILPNIIVEEKSFSS